MKRDFFFKKLLLECHAQTLLHPREIEHAKQHIENQYECLTNIFGEQSTMDYLSGLIQHTDPTPEKLFLSELILGATDHQFPTLETIDTELQKAKDAAISILNAIYPIDQHPNIESRLNTLSDLLLKQSQP